MQQNTDSVPFTLLFFKNNIIMKSEGLSPMISTYKELEKTSIVHLLCPEGVPDGLMVWEGGE